jgi:cell volume regulation protein A
MLAARTLSVFISLLPFKIKLRTKVFLSWVGLRGAVPIVFATYPLLAGAEKANIIFDIVFFVSLTSVLVQGTSLPLVAKWLKLTLPEELKKRTQTDMALTESIKSLLTEITIEEGNPVAGKQIFQLGMPKTTLIAFIFRDNKYVTPNGSTVIRENDKLFVLSENSNSLVEVYKCLSINNQN